MTLQRGAVHFRGQEQARFGAGIYLRLAMPRPNTRSYPTVRGMPNPPAISFICKSASLLKMSALFPRFLHLLISGYALGDVSVQLGMLNRLAIHDGLLSSSKKKMRPPLSCPRHDKYNSKNSSLQLDQYHCFSDRTCESP